MLGLSGQRLRTECPPSPEDSEEELWPWDQVKSPQGSYETDHTDLGHSKNNHGHETLAPGEFESSQQVAQGNFVRGTGTDEWTYGANVVQFLGGDSHVEALPEHPTFGERDPTPSPHPAASRLRAARQAEVPRRENRREWAAGWEQLEVALGELRVIEERVKNFEEQRSNLVEGVRQFKEQIGGSLRHGARENGPREFERPPQPYYQPRMGRGGRNDTSSTTWTSPSPSSTTAMLTTGGDRGEEFPMSNSPLDTILSNLSPLHLSPPQQAMTGGPLTTSPAFAPPPYSELSPTNSRLVVPGTPLQAPKWDAAKSTRSEEEPARRLPEEPTRFRREEWPEDVRPAMNATVPSRGEGPREPIKPVSDCRSGVLMASRLDEARLRTIWGLLRELDQRDQRCDELLRQQQQQAEETERARKEIQSLKEQLSEKERHLQGPSRETGLGHALGAIHEGRESMNPSGSLQFSVTRLTPDRETPWDSPSRSSSSAYTVKSVSSYKERVNRGYFRKNLNGSESMPATDLPLLPMAGRPTGTVLEVNSFYPRCIGTATWTS